MVQLVLGFALALSALVGVQAPAAQAATDLGGINMEAACDNQWGVYSYAVLLSGSPYAWRCRLNIGGTTAYYGLDLNRECRRLHGANAWANHSGSPYSWRCYR